MSKRLFAIINPVVKALLRSPFHGLMSRNTMLLEFKGRKSGKSYCTPVSYHMVGNKVQCLTGQDNQWWRNIVNAESVDLTLRGRRASGRPAVVLGGSSQVQAALHDLLVASPRDAAFASVSFDADGQPNGADVKKAANKLVLISVELS